MGRPGWHIECSVMAGDILGDNMDLHAGGDDLKFPHHDNELAQSEGCYGCNQWVNYFLHAGRLNIDGLKMSKSLKNFTTIKAVLENYPARQMRIMFLRQSWSGTMMYTEMAMEEAKLKERDYKIFLGNCRSAFHELGVEGPQNWTAQDKDFANKLADQREVIHASLCDNFNTPKVMTALDTIINMFNIYMDDPKRSAAPRALLVRKAGEYVSRILSVLGVFAEDNDLGFGVEGATETAARPYLDALRALRDGVRSAAQKKENVSAILNEFTAPPATAEPLAQKYIVALSDFAAKLKTLSTPKEVLEACDEVRDMTLPQLGVVMEDRAGRAARWRLDDPAVLLTEIAERQNEKSNKANASEAPDKIQTRLDKNEKQFEKFQKAEISLDALFGTGDNAGRYSDARDKDGLPNQTADGVEIAKAQKKKLKKELDNHKKLLESLEKQGGQQFLNDLKKRIEEDKSKLA